MNLPVFVQSLQLQIMHAYYYY